MVKLVGIYCIPWLRFVSDLVKVVVVDNDVEMELKWYLELCGCINGL